MLLRGNVGWAALVMAVPMLLAGCQGRGMSGHGSPGVAGGPAPTGIPFPVDRAVAAGLFGTRLEGKDAAAVSPGTLISGDSLVLQAAPHPQFAQYVFANSENAALVAVSAQLISGDGYYVGVADFALGHWQFHGPYAQDTFLELNAAAHLSPLGNIWVAVVAWQAEVQVDYLVFSEDRYRTSPVASFTPAVSGGVVPLTVQFDGSGSYDSDTLDSVVLYEWDFNGDGAWEFSSESPEAECTYSFLGEFHPVLRVTDTGGHRAMIQGRVQAIDASVHAFPSSATGFNPSPSMCLVAGHPAVIYFGPNSYLFYCRAADEEGTQWYDPQVLDTAVSSVGPPSMAIIGGNPAVAYVYNSNVWYIRSNDVAGVSWGGRRAGWPGRTGALAEVADGKPGIVMLNNSGCAYTSADSSAGDSWETPALIGAAQSTWQFNPSLVALHGEPAVAFVDPAGSLVFARRSAGLWSSVEIAPGPCTSSSLTLIADEPGLAWTTQTGSLLYAAADAEGEQWGPPYQLQVGGAAQCRLAHVGGTPTVCFRYEQALCIRMALTPTADTWRPSLFLDPKVRQDAAACAALMDLRGEPALCAPVYKGNSTELRYITGFAWPD